MVCSHDLDGNVPQLRSLSSGLAACEGDGIKCDETKKVVSEIQGSFESVSVRNATIKEKSDDAHPESVEAGVKVDKAKFVQIDHYILFLRCAALTQ